MGEGKRSAIRTAPISEIGRPRTVDSREILNAIFYLVNNGIKRRAAIVNCIYLLSTLDTQ
jgi:hypothetical protein